MAFKLAVGNTVDVPVKLEMFGQVWPMVLVCDRSADHGADVLAMDADAAAAFVRAVAIGWRDQTLVQDDTGAAAAFSPAALDYLLAQNGAAQVLASAYWLHGRAKLKN